MYGRSNGWHVEACAHTKNWLTMCVCQTVWEIAESVCHISYCVLCTEWLRIMNTHTIHWFLFHCSILPLTMTVHHVSFLRTICLWSSICITYKRGLLAHLPEWEKKHTIFAFVLFIHTQCEIISPKTVNEKKKNSLQIQSVNHDFTV